MTAVLLLMIGVVAYALSLPSSNPKLRPFLVDPATAGRLAAERADWKEAEERLAEAAALPGAARAVKLLYARALVQRGRLAAAAKLLRELIQSDPNDSLAVGLMAEALEAAGEIEQASMYAMRAAQLRPDDPYAWKRLALLQVKAGENLEALSTAQRSLDLDPDQEDLKLLVSKLSLTAASLPEIPGAGKRQSIPGLPEFPDPRRLVPDPSDFLPKPHGAGPRAGGAPTMPGFGGPR